MHVSCICVCSDYLPITSTKRISSFFRLIHEHIASCAESLPSSNFTSSLLGNGPLMDDLPINQLIGLRDKLKDNPMIFMGKSMVSCRFFPQVNPLMDDLPLKNGDFPFPLRVKLLESEVNTCGPGPERLQVLDWLLWHSDA